MDDDIGRKASTPRKETKSMRTREGITHENVAGYSPPRLRPPIVIVVLLIQQNVGDHSTRLLLSERRFNLFLRTMDDGDIDFTNPETYLCPAMGTDPHDSCSISMDSYFDDFLKDTETEHLACTHTHACCNPHVRHDLAHHTQTCIHVHTKILREESDDVAETSESPQETDGPKKKRPPGNRAAVRKYREKKKAHTTLLEEEVARLKALNKQLLRRLQSHSALEAEASRLRCLLVDIRGRIEGELGAFPYQRPVKNNDSADQGSFLGGGTQQVRLTCNEPLYRSPEMQATTIDDDCGTSGELLGQAARDIANNQWLPGLPDDVKR
ncbi:unnamed protein product [Triticum turgidum subsp. durum]|uniref:BZIP domain-containing protein n=1 Tax=Triticum turgidum subsp. durum TaxID=4567 RepID=A0A9R1C4F1_TRITD|nr:unnamed protein product [Triticum turgidum subsp. durum]